MVYSEMGSVVLECHDCTVYLPYQGFTVGEKECFD